jgi:adenylate cyclase
MGTEIERKFLVTDPTITEGREGAVIRQGYLSRAPERTVRIRRRGNRAVITIKGASSRATRAEWEYEIPAADADEMLMLCDGPIIDKTRFVIDVAGRAWEVDVFAGANEGLVMAEVELEAEDAAVVLPAWAGLEVTGDPRYYNASLAQHPMGRRTEP